MKKKLKIVKVTAAIVSVAFCALLGCERKEKEAGELLLQLEETGDFQSLPSEAEPVDKNSGEGSKDVPENQAAAAEEAQPGSREEMAASSQADKILPSGTETGLEEALCVVHVCGAVKEPGVYVMDGDARIYQAIERAGGFDPEADENFLNQADLLSDGMKIYVPTEKEVAQSGGEIPWKIPGENGAPGVREEKPGKSAEESAALVNINTAGEEELCTLPGVGSNKAKSIIAYREKNGAYRTIEDIMNVEGIKDGVFQKIKDSITV